MTKEKILGGVPVEKEKCKHVKASEIDTRIYDTTTCKGMLDFTTDLYSCGYTERGYKHWNYTEVPLKLNETQKKKYNVTEDDFNIVYPHKLLLVWDDTPYGGVKDNQGFTECYSANKDTGENKGVCGEFVTKSEKL